MVVKPRVSVFQNYAQRYMRHNIVQDIALATKLVILWTGISVYTSIPVKAKNNNKQSYLLACARDYELRYHNSASGTVSRFVALIVPPRYKKINPTNFSPPQDFATTPRGWPLEATSSTGIRAPPALLAKTGGAVHGILSSERKLDF